MNKLGGHRTAFKVQRALMCELPGMGKAGALERREYPPGQHAFRRKKFSEYSLRLREKQKLIFNYGLREEQLRRLVAKAKSAPDTNWIATLVGMLESRLDAVVFRLGFAGSIPAARQLVTHRKVLVNGKRVSIPSFIVKVGSEISLSESGYKGKTYQESIKDPRLMLPDWLELNANGEFKKGKLKTFPPVEATPFNFEPRLVVEHYSGI